MVPAVEGTRNVLHATGGARRVVVTSSVSAMVPSPGWQAGEVRDDIDYCQNNGVWYPASKTLADKASWKFAEENELCSQQCFDIISHITQVWYPASKMLADKATWKFAENELDVVVVNPGTVLSPKIPPTVNAIMAIFLQLLEGCTQEYADFFMGAVHVEDVALAHILLYSNPSATGRHLCVFSGDYSKRKDPAVLKQKEPILELITSAPVNRHKIKFTKQDTSSLWFLCKQEGGLLNITNQACQFFTEAEDCGNKDFCPFDDFKKQKKIVEPHLKHDYDRLCKIKKLVVTEGPSAFSYKLSGSILAERVPC